jgi:hypothetical protein
MLSLQDENTDSNAIFHISQKQMLLCCDCSQIILGSFDIGIKTGFWFQFSKII